MVALLITYLIVTVCTTLGTFVVLRAWDHPPARMFVLVVVVLVLMNIITSTRPFVTNVHVAYVFASLSIMMLAFLSLLLLLLFSLMFMPQWWAGTRPIRWIMLPYVLVLGAICLDLLGSMGWFVKGISLDDGVYRFDMVQPNAIVLLGLFTVGWMVQLILLISAFAYNREARSTIGLLFISLTIATVAANVTASVPELRNWANVAATVPMLGTMAYAVLRTRLLTPTRAALDLAIQAMSDAVLVLDLDENVVYANQTAKALGLVDGKPLRELLTTLGVDPADIAALTTATRGKKLPAMRTLMLDEHHIVCSRTAVTDARGAPVGTLLLGRDVTDVEQRTTQLVQERARLEATVQQLEDEKRERLQLADTVRALSLPVIPVLPGVLVLPMIGHFDAERIRDFSQVLLTNIEREHARVVLIDITGLPFLDTEGAAGFLRGVQAAGLLGSRCVLVGVRPEIAQSLVNLGVSSSCLETAATLQQALQREIRHGRRR